MMAVLASLAPSLIHPAGNWLLNLAIQRDSTALIESYHLRLEVAKVQMAKLPEITSFPIEAVPRSPYPGDSALYAKIKARLSTELFKGGGQLKPSLNQDDSIQNAKYQPMI